MSKKKDMEQEQLALRPRRPRVGYVMVSPAGMPVPAPMPSDNLQIQPIVQPMVLMVNTAQANRPSYDNYPDEEY